MILILESGGNVTKNSKLILDIINNSNDHLTAEEVYYKIKVINPKVVLATIYNNLNYLTKEGYIKKVLIDNGPDCYDKIVRHDHLICSKCGGIKDITLEDLSRKLEEETGVSILSYDLQIHYICDECKE